MKQKLIAVFVMTFAALFFNQKTNAQTKNPNETIAVDAASIEKWVQSQLEKQSFVGSSIAVMHRGKSFSPEAMTKTRSKRAKRLIRTRFSMSVR